MLDFTTIIDYIGTFAFAISGVRLSARKNFDLFGAFVVGFVTAVGGGSIRDVALGLTPFWMLDAHYVIVTVLALLTVIVFKKWIVKLEYTFFIFDAVGLGLFTVVGIEKSMAAGFPMWVNIIMGSITGAAGGVIRDSCITAIPLIFRKDIYAVACFVGGFFYWLCMVLGADSVTTQLVAAVSVIATRVICVRFNVSLPSLKGDN